MTGLTCADVLDVVDAIASGDLAVTADLASHLEACPRCAASLAIARRIETMIAARPAPAPPPRFADAVRRRISRERWRAEQSVDWLFNIAIAVGILVVVGGLAALMNIQALLAAVDAAWSLVTAAGSDVARQAAPTVVTYIAAFGLLVSTVGIWWWAERRLSL